MPKLKNSNSTFWLIFKQCASLFAGVLVWFCGGLSIIPSVSSVLGEKVVSVSAWEEREEHGPFSIGKNLFCLFLLFLYMFNCSRHTESFIGMCTSEAKLVIYQRELWKKREEKAKLPSSNDGCASPCHKSRCQRSEASRASAARLTTIFAKTTAVDIQSLL